jgi:glycosyltransferase involved in cell wall biosynthesis
VILCAYCTSCETITGVEQTKITKREKFVPKVTVVTIVYNDAANILRTLNSVFEQSSRDYEFLVIDGCSSDGTGELLRALTDKIDKLYIEPDDGIYDAMEKAVDRAAGDWIIFMNSGDVFDDTDVIARFLAAEPEADLAYGAVYYWGPAGDHFRPTRPLGELWKGMVFSHQALFTRREVLREFGFNRALGIASDYALIVRCERAGLKFYDIGFVVAHCQGGGKSDVSFYRSISERFMIAASVYPVLPMLLFYLSLPFGREWRRLKRWTTERMTGVWNPPVTEAVVAASDNPGLARARRALADGRIDYAGGEVYNALNNARYFVPQFHRQRWRGNSVTDQLVAALSRAPVYEALQDLVCADVIRALGRAQENNREIFIWGVEEKSRQAGALLARLGLPIQAFIDPREGAMATRFQDIQATSLDQFSRTQSPATGFVLVAAMQYFQAVDWLRNHGYRPYDGFVA